MRTLGVLTLLSAAVLLCSAAPGLEPLTCREVNSSVAADKAVHHINEYHDHGYKFRLHEVQGNSVEQVDGGCNVKLQLDLRETKCQTIDTEPFEKCEIRGETELAVKANCTVLMTIKDGDANITKYECDTRQVKTIAEMRRICPDCPILLPLNDSESLKFIHDMVKLFNINIAKKHYYILQDVARITAGKYMHENYAEFVLVESRCPVGSKIPIEECTPLCPDRADYAYCQGFEGFECYINDPKNTTALGPGEEEPVCGHHERSQPHDHEHGHGSPPTGGKGKGSFHPLRRFHPCHEFLVNPDPALHPICPWPLPHRTQNESRIS